MTRANAEPVLYQRARCEGSRPLVLYVEDNPAHRRLVERILVEHGGFDVHAAENAREALNAAQRRCPALVLLDLCLPDATGEELIALLRTMDATRSVPVVVLTARAEESSRECLLRAGVAAYLTKPFQVADLMAAVFAAVPAQAPPMG